MSKQCSTDHGQHQRSDNTFDAWSRHKFLLSIYRLDFYNNPGIKPSYLKGMSFACPPGGDRNSL
jgi:hypothetical protein